MSSIFQRSFTMEITSLQTTQLASQINELDKKAKAHAQDAIEYARQAGELMLSVKKRLPHGQWTDWAEKNLTVSLRQCQRYIAVAQGKVVPVRQLAGKNDTVSFLDPPNKKPNLIRCQGEWIDGSWRPKPGFFYLFKEGGANYWAHPSTRDDRWFHVCKHYDGPRMSTEGFFRRYTVFSPITDPAFTLEQYVGTTTPLGWIGVGDVLKSYGLKDISDSLSLSLAAPGGLSRPFGEPDFEDFYEDWHDIEELKSEKSSAP
jgi:hypothetical protein